ncbi:MAG: glutamine-hydrolyzing carbamoyl-phosphate synthase small subunit [Melioribacteraceae bacterium]|nr:glutamine-hydrolyzing carbamoyl-phosphate synthase small subunit [Melioribacteraceae bacterium]
METAKLVFENNFSLTGKLFGAAKSAAGEIVFNTGMVGYPETLTDPSYTGQILVLTFPLIGNYGIEKELELVSSSFESKGIKISGLIISDYSKDFSHWSAFNSLSKWMTKYNVPGLCDVDTRELTKILREKGTMLGKIEIETDPIDFFDPNHINLFDKVAPSELQVYGVGKSILLYDCGCKENIVRNLVDRGYQVKRAPWNYDFTQTEFDAVLFSNGPGNPEMYPELVDTARQIFRTGKPVLGICMGHQIVSLAAGASTYKMKYGHRSQNQPVINKLNNRCYVTSQNHGYAVDTSSLSSDWNIWFENLNDGTNEGIIHKELPVMSVQFHPEAAPGPVDTEFIFDEFLGKI